MLEDSLKLGMTLMDLGATETAAVGSTYILGQGADIDILVLVPNRFQFANRMEKDGWVLEGAAHYPDNDFTSVRQGKYNVLITSDASWFARFKTAAEVCKALRLEDKEQRILVHSIVRDGMSAEGF